MEYTFSNKSFLSLRPVGLHWRVRPALGGAGGAFQPPAIPETTGTIFNIQKAFNIPAELSRDQISLSLVRPLLVKLRSRAEASFTIKKLMTAITFGKVAADSFNNC